MAPKYEFSTLTKSDTIWDMEKLQANGRNVDYVDTRKKKAPAAAAAPGRRAEQPEHRCRKPDGDPEGEAK